MEPPCFAAPSAAEATSKARKQSGCYMAVVMLSVGNPRARPLIDESWCNKAASAAYQCAQVKTRFIIRHLLHGIQMMSCKIPTHTQKKIWQRPFKRFVGNNKWKSAAAEYSKFSHCIQASQASVLLCVRYPVQLRPQAGRPCACKWSKFVLCCLFNGTTN